MHCIPSAVRGPLFMITATGSVVAAGLTIVTLDERKRRLTVVA